MAKVRLDPCPRCGKQPQVIRTKTMLPEVQSVKYVGYEIECSCGIKTKAFNKLDTLARWWNCEGWDSWMLKRVNKQGGTDGV